MRAPRALCQIQPFEDQYAGALGHDEPIAAGVKRPAGALRVVVAVAQGAHALEPGRSMAHDRGF